MNPRTSRSTASTKGIREAELETLLSSPDSVGDDRPGGDFFARTMPVPLHEEELTGHVGRIVKVYRLKEVIAQVGFTRFESAVSDVNGELDVNVERASLSIDQQWLPAVENRGEGVFLGFKQDAIQAWLERPAVKARTQQPLNGSNAWDKAHPGTKATNATFPVETLWTRPTYVTFFSVCQLPGFRAHASRSCKASMMATARPHPSNGGGEGYGH